MIQKIAVFWLCVYLAVWVLRRRPNSAISRLAFSWQGPFPIDGELKSSYYRRKAAFALGWLMQILAAAAILALIVMYASPKSDSISLAIMVIAFALTIGLGMAVLGALLAVLTSLKALLLGPDPTFSPHEPMPVEDVDDRESEQHES